MAEEVNPRGAAVRTVAAIAVLIRGAALLICIAPFVAVLVRVAVGLDAMRPWRDWSCALPMSILLGVCPSASPPDPHRQASVVDLAWTAGLALIALPAYLRSFAWLAWLLAMSVGASWFALIGAALVIAPGRRPGDPVPVWMGNALVLIGVLFAAPLAIHAARFAKRRSEGRFFHPPPARISAATSGPTRPDA